MGNRAFITDKNKRLGVYLHWNGGRDSVEAFLKYCELRQFRSPEVDGYGWARLCQVIGNYFDADGLSVGIEPYSTDKNMVSLAADNGVYIIEDWKIVDRIYPYKGFVEQEAHGLDLMLLDIDGSQPDRQELGYDFLMADERLGSDLKIGDVVFIYTHLGWRKYTVVGFGASRWYLDQPMVNRCVAADNPNNYLSLTETYRCVTGSKEGE